MSCCTQQQNQKTHHSKTEKIITIALAGQPNAGKSSLINALSGAHLKTGNFSGVTIEKTIVELERNGYILRFVDLPGLYQLGCGSLEEQISSQFLQNEQYDLIVNVLDSTNLARNLALTLQLCEFGKPMILALNMADEARLEGIHINTQKLSEKLGIQAISVSAHTKENIENLLEQIIAQDCQNFQNLAPCNVGIADSQKLGYIMNQAAQIALEVSESKSLDSENLVTTTQKLDKILAHKFFGLPIFLFFMWALFQITFTLGEYPKVWIEDAMDWLGEQTYELLAPAENEKQNLDSEKSAVEDLDENFQNLDSEILPTLQQNLASLIGEGIIPGVGAVLSFVPHILIVFLGIILLESSGYMARASYLLDGILRRFGLHGKSFVPLIMGFGCSVPAFMATRTLQNKADKLLTLFIINFMSCSARLPIYTLFVGVFFSSAQAGNALFCIYIFGALVGILSAKILKLSFFKNAKEPFVMEMPKYRLPSAKLVLFSVWQKLAMYVKKAGGFILLASVLIWFGSNYPHNEEIAQFYDAQIEQIAALQSDSELDSENAPDSENFQNLIQNLEWQRDSKLLESSFLGRIGNFIAPIFAPMGFDWRLSVSLVNGLAAKEVVVSSMGVLYALGEVDENSETLREKIQNNVSLSSAVAFILFVMFYMPCLAASAVFTKEAGGLKYTILLFIFTSLTAYFWAFVGYEVVSFFGF